MQVPDNDFKKKREDYSISIRRSQREETFSRRRGADFKQADSQPSKQAVVIIVDPRFQTQISNFIRAEYKIEEVGQLFEALASGDIVQNHRGIIGLRKILQKAQIDFVQQLCITNIVPSIVQMANQEEFPQIRMEAVWALANLAASTKEVCEYLVQLGCIECFISAASSSLLNVSEQAVWAIGNLAADSIEYRDIILQSGGLSQTISYIEKLDPLAKKKISNACWAIANLCRGQPPPNYELIRQALPVLGDAIKNDIIKSQEVLSDCLWTLSYLAEGPKVRLSRMIETGACPRIMSYTTRTYLGVCLPSLRIMGNLSTGTELHTNTLLQYGFLDISLSILCHTKGIMRKQVCWILSNIAAGTPQQVIELLRRPQIIQKLIEILDKDERLDIRVEALWVFANLAKAGVPEQIMKLYEVVGIIDKSLVLLSDSNQYVLVSALDCLFYVFKLGDRTEDPEDLEMNFLKREALERGIIGILEELQGNESKKVCQSASKLLDRFFVVESQQQI